MNNIKANIQLLDNYIKEFEIKLENKIPETEEYELGISISFEIDRIEEKEEKLGQVTMIYTIDINKKEEKLGKIHLVMQALFTGNKEIENKKFEEMLKYNGASILSQIIRAYIITSTSLSGMPTINLPMINFIEFFNKSEKIKK